MPKLGVNIDHVATLRQARRELDPDPVHAAKICERAGADSIVCHLREDRRHIQDADLFKIKKAIHIPLNFEMSIHPAIVKIASRVRPTYAMLVPEKREEITTEGGLNVIKYAKLLKGVIRQLRRNKITVSIFVDPRMDQIQKSKELGASIVELHTGAYANAKVDKNRKMEVLKLKRAAKFAHNLGLIVHAGHGLKYTNVGTIAKIPYIDELNIGHSIISHAIFIGLAPAVRKMKRLLR